MNWTGEEVKLLRNRMGWSQAELARLLQVELEMVFDVESGQSEIPCELKNSLLRFHQQADSCSDRVMRRPLAEVIMRDRGLSQIHEMEVIESIELSADLKNSALVEKNS